MQFGQTAKHSHKTLRYNLVVFKPKVEYISDQEECLGIPLNLLQEVEKVALNAPLFSRVTRAEMYVCNEVVHRDILLFG